MENYSAWYIETFIKPIRNTLTKKFITTEPFFGNKNEAISIADGYKNKSLKPKKVTLDLDVGYLKFVFGSGDVSAYINKKTNTWYFAID